ncbi:uncharacterized protein LOC118510676 isoform X2 [Anopheles stephensi]|uniref:uncharacterized protein LOC118510676 isoform X2 n=1 Tax=Anopheles stephensi TaxID=30069 RepID=UPI00165895ED|nr:uncharacterized protein LOC118510676 isoform X2 [Anopheles stephensi]
MPVLWTNNKLRKINLLQSVPPPKAETCEFVEKRGGKYSLQQPGHYVWHHFEKEAGGKAKCSYCNVSLSCPNNIVCNLMRHMKSKHPLIPLENQLEYIRSDGIRMYQESQSLDDEIEESFKASASLHDSEELELSSIELMGADDGSDSVKIEYEQIDPDPKLNEDSQEVIEEIVHDADLHQNVDIECLETNSSSQMTSNMYDQPNQETAQPSHESTIEFGHQNDTTQSEPTHSSEDGLAGGSQNFLHGLQNVSVRTAAYATNIALELDSVQSRQRIIAEKLIADVLFYAKLEHLTEHSMILVKMNLASPNL